MGDECCLNLTQYLMFGFLQSTCPCIGPALHLLYFRQRKYRQGTHRYAAVIDTPVKKAIDKNIHIQVERINSSYFTQNNPIVQVPCLWSSPFWHHIIKHCQRQNIGWDKSMIIPTCQTGKLSRRWSTFHFKCLKHLPYVFLRSGGPRLD